MSSYIVDLFWTVLKTNLVFLLFAAETCLTAVTVLHWNKKKIKFFSNTYKEIKNGAVAKSYITASSYIGKYLRISSYIRKPFLIYDFATALLWISLYMSKIWFSFLSVYDLAMNCRSTLKTYSPWRLFSALLKHKLCMYWQILDVRFHIWKPLMETFSKCTNNQQNSTWNIRELCFHKSV